MIKTSVGKLEYDEYKYIADACNKHNEVLIKDNLDGFDKNLNCWVLDQIPQKKSKWQMTIRSEFIFDDTVKFKYPNIKFIFDCNFQNEQNLKHFHTYNIHPELNYKNFICSFNGSASIGRQLLTSLLNNQGYFNSEYSSKNFSYNNDSIIGHLNYCDLTDLEIGLYSKFFVNNNEFNNSVYSFNYTRDDHLNNIYNLEHKLTQSFVHVVSETLAHTYYPMVTEKFLYSIVTRGLFLAYAQPGWQAHIEKYYGFKLYDQIFDYDFDAIQNPVKRLIRLMEMISKFSKLSADDWRDLYLLEQETIEYNYDHYFSGNYLKCIAQYE